MPCRRARQGTVRSRQELGCRPAADSPPSLPAPWSQAPTLLRDSRLHCLQAASVRGFVRGQKTQTRPPGRGNSRHTGPGDRIPCPLLWKWTNGRIRLNPSPTPAPLASAAPPLQDQANPPTALSPQRPASSPLTPSSPHLLPLCSKLHTCSNPFTRRMFTEHLLCAGHCCPW